MGLESSYMMREGDEWVSNHTQSLPLEPIFIEKLRIATRRDELSSSLSCFIVSWIESRDRIQHISSFRNCSAYRPEAIRLFIYSKLQFIQT